MAVDANFLIFERIREELARGKTVRTAINEGFDHALSAIIDTHVTTALTALILYQFGTGPVRGLRRHPDRGPRRLAVQRHLRRANALPPLAQPFPRRSNPEHLMLRILHDTHVDFIRLWRWRTALILLFIIPGADSHRHLGLPLEHRVHRRDAHAAGVRPGAGHRRGPLDAVERRHSGRGDPDVRLATRVPRSRAGRAARRAAESSARNRSPNGFAARSMAASERLHTASCAPKASGPASAVSSGVRPLLAVVLVVRRDAGLPRVAVRVAIRRGRDRGDDARHHRDARLHEVHEHRDLALRRRRGADRDRLLAQRQGRGLRPRAREPRSCTARCRCTTLLNRSVNETLPRTVMTGSTTLATLLALLIFGGEVIRPFAWVLTFGIIVGTFSSIYVAGAGPALDRAEVAAAGGREGRCRAQPARAARANRRHGRPSRSERADRADRPAVPA